MDLQTQIIEQQLLLALTEGNLNYFEQAQAMQTLCTEYNYTQASLAKRLGISQSCVGNKIRLLQYGENERAQFLKYGLSERHARVLLRIQPPKREKLIATAGNLHLTVQQTEELVEKQGTDTLVLQARSQHTDASSVEGYMLQIQNGANRMRNMGYKITCLTESGEGWHRITVTVLD